MWGGRVVSGNLGQVLRTGSPSLWMGCACSWWGVGEFWEKKGGDSFGLVVSVLFVGFGMFS